MLFKNLRENNEKLISNDVVSLIMTENCPFQCKHCMREERRPNTISEEVIDLLLSQVIINGELHLGGGEPLSATDKAIYLLNRLQYFGSKPKALNMISNGSICPEKFERFVAAIPKGMAVKLMISNDYYHVQERLRLNKNVDNIITRLREYQAIFCKHGFSRPIDDYFWMLEPYDNFQNGNGVSAIGYGANIPGATIIERDFKLHKNVNIENGYIKGKIQVQTDGRITQYLDMSWKECDQHYGHEYSLHEKPLKRILTNKYL